MRAGLHRSFLVACAALVAFASAAAGEAPPTVPVDVGARSAGLADDLQAALDSARRRARAPGAVAAAVVDGRVVWSGVSGHTTTSRRRRVSAATRFITASSAKSVTAALVVRLADDGALALDQPLSDFTTALPGAERIPVRRLLDHTSGLDDYLDRPRIQRLQDRSPYRAWRRAELYEGARLLFEPGARERYSNTGYVAAGEVIERAGGGVEAAFQRLFGIPLSLRRTTFAYGAGLSRQFAAPHADEDGEIVSQLPRQGRIPTHYWGEVWTDGGLATTAPELALLGNGIYAGGLVSEAGRAAMLDFGSDGSGLGTYPLAFSGRRWVGHDGAYAGYESELWTDVERKLTIAVLTNLEEGERASRSISERIWRAVATAYARGS